MSFYRNGCSRVLPDNTNYGSMYEFPSGPTTNGIEQKLDMVLSHILEQKEISGKIENETKDLRSIVDTLVSDLSHLKEKIEHPSVNGSSTSVRKKIPTELSVSLSQEIATIITSRKVIIIFTGSCTSRHAPISLILNGNGGLKKKPHARLLLHCLHFFHYNCSHTDSIDT